MEFEPYAGDLLQHLASLIVLARQLELDPRGAFEEAAADLSVDVSVLRRRVQSLTGYFAVPLLGGRGASLHLTEEGERVFAGANRTLLDLEQLRERVSGRVGRVRIGSTGAVSTERLPLILRAAQRRWPELEVHIRRTDTRAARALLDRGEIDLAVLRSKEAPAGVKSRSIGADRLWLACARGHALAASPPERLTIDELARWPQITYPQGSYTRARVMESLQKAGASPRIEVDGKTSALRYAELDIGIAFISLLDGQIPKHRGVVFMEVTRLFAKTSFWVAWRRGHPLRPAEAFIAEGLVTASPRQNQPAATR